MESENKMEEEKKPEEEAKQPAEVIDSKPPKKEKKPKAAKPVDLAKKYMRKECEDLLRRKFFYIQSFEIYGGVSGLYDYGPLGSALKANVESLWRNHFVLEEEMLEMTCSSLTLSDVLQTSVSIIPLIGVSHTGIMRHFAIS